MVTSFRVVVHGHCLTRERTSVCAINVLPSEKSVLSILLRLQRACCDVSKREWYRADEVGADFIIVPGFNYHSVINNRDTDRNQQSLAN